jgi:hypothetical protein
MSIVARFRPSGMTKQQYDQASQQIEAKLDWPPDGLQMHVCFGDDGDLSVSEIWESREKMEAFGERLMPALQEAGIQLSSEPEVYEIHQLDVTPALKGTR